MQEKKMWMQGLLGMVMGGGLPPADVLDFVKSNGSSKLSDQASLLCTCLKLLIHCK